MPEANSKDLREEMARLAREAEEWAERARASGMEKDAADFEFIASDLRGWQDILRLFDGAERQKAREATPGYHRTPKAERPGCGARCRDGHPCRALAVWDRVNNRPRNGRCRMHGGLSTGPRTAEGKARSREGARKRGRVSAARRGVPVP